ncbi:MAG: cation:proton antiporter [Ilumatobacteraceae bacterium]
MDIVKFVAPSGPEWELLLAVVVAIVAPVIVERVRLPGMVGLLFGGMVIGPNVLDVTSADSGVVSELGGFGLLYLMFMAGLDLDLNVFAKVRKHAVVFALVTFALPFALGLMIGSTVGYGVDAAVLLGAVFASHTLVTYPLIRSYGLSTNRAVAITVGATVITDTMALVVLAIVSGQVSGSGSGFELAAQIAIGLAILGLTCFGVMPVVGRWYFTTIGRSRVARYTFILGVLLTGAAVATMVGIESIVGAFFAGLGINRLVPSEGEVMERVEFFGSAFLIPLFLVSVGTVIDPTKLIAPGTLGLAALFALGALGGKAVAAAVARFAFHLTWAESGVVFSLSASRAAATLAATFVGLQLGLFDTSTVNAIMLVIVLSLVASSITATMFGQRVPRPPMETERVGRSVLVQLDLADGVGVLAAVAARLARVDGGVVRPLYVVTPGAPAPTTQETHVINHDIAGLGIDASLDVRFDRSWADGLANAAASYSSSLIIVQSGASKIGSSTIDVTTLGRDVRAPMATIRPSADVPARVVLVLPAGHATRPRHIVMIAISVAVRLGRSGLPAVVVCEHDLDSSVRTAIGSSTVLREPVLEWIDASLQRTDLVIVAGGRLGGSATSRAERRAASGGATVMLLTDPEEVDVAADASSVAAPLTAS